MVACGSTTTRPASRSRSSWASPLREPSACSPLRCGTGTCGTGRERNQLVSVIGARPYGAYINRPPAPKQYAGAGVGRRYGVRPPHGSCSVRRMAWRAAWLVVVLAVGGGCSPIPPYRDLCDQDANPDCCPRGSHQVFQPPAL